MKIGMKTGRILKKSIQMNGFSKGEAYSVEQCVKEVFPGSHVVVNQNKNDRYLLTIMLPASLNPMTIANELFPLLNIQLQ